MVRINHSNEYRRTGALYTGVVDASAVYRTSRKFASSKQKLLFLTLIKIARRRVPLVGVVRARNSRSSVIFNESRNIKGTPFLFSPRSGAGVRAV